MELDTYTYILAVRESSQLKPNHNIQDFFNELNLIIYDANGYYYNYGNPTQSKGLYRFCETKELHKIAQEFSWPLLSKCPFVGSVIGYCLFQPWDDDFFDYLLGLALNHGLGFIANVEDGAYFDIVTERTFTLRQVVDRHGFGEGALTLMHNDEYFRYVRNAINNALEPLGLKPEVFHDGDHPHILSGFEDDEKNRVKNWELFELNADKITLKLWIANWGDKKLRYLLSNDEQTH